MDPVLVASRGPSKRFNKVNTTNLHISSHVHDAVLLFCISPFTNGPTTNETIQKSSRLWQKLCSLLSKVCRWLLQTWKHWWWLKALAAKLLPLGLPGWTKGLVGLIICLLWALLGWNFLRTPHLVLKYFWMRLITWNPHTFPMTAQCHIPAFWDFSARIFSREPSSAAWSNVRSAEASNVSHLQLG